MIEQAFEVATEFKFDVGQALISTKGLQDAVDDVSKSANGAMASLGYLASGLVAHLGFGSGGLLSVLTKAVQISEEFNNSSLQFANNISTNISVLAGTISTFNDRLQTSEMLMGNISTEAIKLGVDTTELANITKMIATPLAMRGKLGTNYQGAIGMAGNLMVGGQAAGLHPQVASESLYRALTEHMPLHGALFARMVNTPAFKNAHVATQQQLMGMNQDKKIDLLAKSLEQLAGDAEFATHRLNQIGTQFTILKDQIAVVLRPIGDAIVKPIRMMLQAVNNYLNLHGKDLGDAISKLIGNIFDDPRKLFISLYQMKNLGGDFKKALHLTELFQMFMFLKWGLGKVGIVLNGGLLRTGLKYFVEGLETIGAWLWRVGFIGKVFSLLGNAAAEVLPVFLSFLYFFQIISRARGIAMANDIEKMALLTPRLANVMVRLKTAFEQVMLPINMSIDAWAKILAPLFETSTWLAALVDTLEAFATVLEWIGKGVIYLMGGLSALSNVIVGFVYDIVNMKNPFGHTLDRLKEGYEDWMSAHPFGDKDKKAVVNQVTNVGKIEANFDMREQLEPDRVAFAVTTKLKQLAMNPTQGRGQSMNTGFGGAVAIAGSR